MVGGGLCLSDQEVVRVALLTCGVEVSKPVGRAPALDLLQRPDYRVSRGEGIIGDLQILHVGRPDGVSEDPNQVPGKVAPLGSRCSSPFADQPK